jgi:hypothetical protein
MFMDGLDWIALVAMLMLLMILLMLLVQYLQTNKAWRLLEHWHATTKERQARLNWHAEAQGGNSAGIVAVSVKWEALIQGPREWRRYGMNIRRNACSIRWIFAGFWKAMVAA